MDVGLIRFLCVYAKEYRGIQRGGRFLLEWGVLKRVQDSGVRGVWRVLLVHPSALPEPQWVCSSGLRYCKRKVANSSSLRDSFFSKPHGFVCTKNLFLLKCPFSSSALPPGNAVETSCWPSWSPVRDATQQPGQNDSTGSAARLCLVLNTRQCLRAPFWPFPLVGRTSSWSGRQTSPRRCTASRATPRRSPRSPALPLTAAWWASTPTGASWGSAFPSPHRGTTKVSAASRDVLI